MQVLREAEAKRFEELGSRLRTQRLEAEERKKEREVKLTDKVPPPKRARIGCRSNVHYNGREFIIDFVIIICRASDHAAQDFNPEGTVRSLQNPEKYIFRSYGSSNAPHQRLRRSVLRPEL